MIFGISENTWKSYNRKERYQYLRSIGVSSDDARKGRDLKYNKVRGSASLAIPKEKLNKKERKVLWSKLSSFWQKNEATQKKMFNSFNPYEKKVSKEWRDQAVEFNKALWNSLSKTDRKLIKWSDAKNHSAGYALVYRHYVLGQSWKKAREGIKIDPYVEPDEYQ